ncbi:hypothetical protein, conserved [Babesia ovata]|uniref:Uncharacterized protein n=1 Tax=Babesia ovata TaxID=189622 RepID=A0A2H6KEJ9_9APIC|nr:uncharacterized protein BOVATA_029090 [Babesia ovata]GBE61416.1 hypothetical protein, conserved [Babesia ovata]
MECRLGVYISCFYVIAFVIASEYSEVSSALRKWDGKETTNNAVLEIVTLRYEYCDPWSEWSVCDSNNQHLRLRWCVFKRRNAPVTDANNPTGISRETLERLRFIEDKPRQHLSPDEVAELFWQQVNCTDASLAYDGVSGQKQSDTDQVLPFNRINVGQRTDVVNDQYTHMDSEVSNMVGYPILGSEHKMLQEKTAFDQLKPHCQMELNKMSRDIYTRRELAKIEREQAILRRDVSRQRYDNVCAGVLSALDPHILSQIEEDKRYAKVEYDRAEDALKQQISNARVADDRARAKISANNTTGNVKIDQLRHDIYKQRQYAREVQVRMESPRDVARQRYDNVCAGVLSALDPHILSQIEEDKRRAKVEYDRAEEALKQQISNARFADDRAIAVFKAESGRWAKEIGLEANGVKDTSQRDRSAEEQLDNNVQNVKERIQSADLTPPDKREVLEEGRYHTSNSDHKPHNNFKEATSISKKQDQDIYGNLHAESRSAESNESLVNDGSTISHKNKSNDHLAKPNLTGPTSGNQSNRVDVSTTNNGVHEKTDEYEPLSDATDHTSKTVLNPGLWKMHARGTEKRRIAPTSRYNAVSSKSDIQGESKHGVNAEAQVINSGVNEATHFDVTKHLWIAVDEMDTNRYVKDLEHAIAITNGKRIGTIQPLHEKRHHRPLTGTAQTGLETLIKESKNIQVPQPSVEVGGDNSYKSLNHASSQDGKGLKEWTWTSMPLELDELKGSTNPNHNGTHRVAVKVMRRTSGTADEGINIPTKSSPATSEEPTPKKRNPQTIKTAGAGFAALLILTAGSAAYYKKKRLCRASSSSLTEEVGFDIYEGGNATNVETAVHIGDDSWAETMNNSSRDSIHSSLARE